MKLAAARRAWARWQSAAGPWRGWSICPSLLSPELEALAPTRPPSPAKARELAARIAPLFDAGATLCLLELEPALGIQVAARLVDRAYTVLLLPRWPYAQAVLPTDQLAATLVHEARALPERTARLANVIFVTDADRTRALPDRAARDPRADNRYQLASFDLPDLATLRTRGITHIQRIGYERR